MSLKSDIRLPRQFCISMKYVNCKNKAVYSGLYPFFSYIIYRLKEVDISATPEK